MAVPNPRYRRTREAYTHSADGDTPVSVQHISWAMEQTTGNPTRKAVLVALADFTNAETGKCCPYISTIAARTEYSEKTVQRALNDLVVAGFVERSRRKRPDGKQAGYDYRLPAVLVIQVRREPEVTESAGPEVTESAHEPGRSLEPTTPPVVPPESNEVVLRRRVITVDRKQATVQEVTLAAVVLGTWNRTFDQNLTSVEWLSKIIMRLREHPEYGIPEHVSIIETAFADPWWTGAPSPSVVYGNGALFERCVEAAKAKANGRASPEKPGRYGRGLTTRQILDMTKGR